MGSIIRSKKITRRFPGVVANDHISINTEEGEIHTLAGENGAGKSTLMNTLYGLCQPDEGELLIRGESVHFTNSRDSIHHKIDMVHQHFMLIPKLTVTENIIVDQEVDTALKVNRAGASQKIKALSEQYGLKVDPDKKVNELSITEQWRAEILKVLYREAEILIFDESTAVLTPQGVGGFYDILLRPKEKEKTIIFVSHKLAKVMKISDRIAVVRLSRVVDIVDKSETNPESLTKMMVGRNVNLGRREQKQAEKIGNILGVEDVSYTVDRTMEKLNHISLELRKGEVLGTAGVGDNGQEELVNIICRKIKPDSGPVIMNGRDITRKKIRTRKDNDLGLTPGDRHRDDLVLECSIANDLILGRQHQEPYAEKNIWLDFKKIHETAETLKKRFDTRCANVGVSAGTLSDGNQQKIIIAREAYRNPDMLVAIQLARELDMGTMEFVQKTLLGQRDQGKGVLLFSLELDEVLPVNDRITVTFKGETTDIVDAGSVTRREPGAMTLGSSRGKGGTAVGTAD